MRACAVTLFVWKTKSASARRCARVSSSEVMALDVTRLTSSMSAFSSCSAVTPRRAVALTVKRKGSRRLGDPASTRVASPFSTSPW